jgi:arginine N-succinyltransferase
VIGQVHPQTEPARQLLESEGFYFAQMVDIFDGGPCVRCDRNAIRTISQSSRCPVVAEMEHDASLRSDSLVASATGDFRVIGCVVGGTPDGVMMTAKDMQRMRVRVGDEVLVAPLKGTAAEFWKQRQPGTSRTP